MWVHVAISVGSEAFVSRLSLDTKDGRVGWNAVQGEAVAGGVLVHVEWHAAETKGWKFTVVVIGFEDLAN